MPSRLIIILSSLSLFCLAGCAGVPAGADATRFGHTTVITGDFPMLEKGMTVEEVRQKLGDPAEIKPMDAIEGQTEVWVYYLEKYLGKTQIVNYINRPSLSGSFANDPIGMVPEPVYTMVDQKVMVTLSLLMFNGRLSAQTARSEKRLEF